MTRRLCAASALVSLLGACGGEAPRTAVDANAGAARPLVHAGRAATEAVAGEPQGTFAHDRHAELGLACEACHACAGAYAFSTVTLPDGTGTAGASMTNTPGTAGHVAGGTTCSVACHGEPGVPLGTAVWNHGPMSCTGCHQRIGSDVRAARSTHVRDADDPVLGRAGCQACHQLDTHHSGVVHLVNGDGTPVIAPGSDGDLDAFCKSCHDAAGHAIGGDAPPVLLGFEAGGADPHGASGYATALSCSACHAAHGSANAFLFASTVNGVAVPPGTIDRAGVGGDALCFACHPQSPRHAASGCMVQCHSHEGTAVGHATQPPVPASGACFSCHGHEGIEHFLPPTGCKHCHGNSGWRPSSHPPEAIPPRLLSLTAVPSATGASFQWRTDEYADSWVSYTANGTTLTAGSGADAVQHAVTVAGLQPGLAYDVEVRSVDAFHNVASARLLLTPGGPSVPALAPRGDVPGGAGTVAVTLGWSAVTSPNGGVSYALEVAPDATFAAPAATLTTAASSAVVELPSGAWAWRVTARDASGLASRSVAGTFTVGAGAP